MFKQLLEKLLCKHNWKVHCTIDVYKNNNGVISKDPYKTKQTLICKKCGKIKKIEL